MVSIPKWQEVILGNDDLSVFEVIALRGVGKTTFGIGWLSDADTKIMMVHNHHVARHVRKEILDEESNIKVITSSHQLRGINLKGNIKIFVDEHFQQIVDLAELDIAVGHTNYKVLFAGSKVKNDDKFKIPFAKQIYVGLEALMVDYYMYSGLIQNIVIKDRKDIVPMIEVN
jgi:hypothetical protein